MLGFSPIATKPIAAQPAAADSGGGGDTSSSGGWQHYSMTKRAGRR